MCLFRRKRSSTLSWRTSWLSKVDPKLPKSFKFTSRTWRKEQISWKRWWESLKTINHRSMPINLRLKGLISRLAKSKKFTSTVSTTRSSTKIWRENKWRIWIPILSNSSSRWCNSRCPTSRHQVLCCKANLQEMLKCDNPPYYIIPYENYTI